MTTVSSSTPSPLQPLNASAAAQEAIGQETEKKAGWLVGHLVRSMAGRIVMSAYETLRATGTNVVCLSPWGDSSPLFLPCIRFRDVAIHTVIVATGGAAAVASPLMGSAAEVVVDSFGSTILVEVGVHAGYEAGGSIINHYLVSKPVDKLIPQHDKRLETTAVLTLLITLKYGHLIEDAAMGFFRASNHSDPSLFSNVKDYLAIEKGWFNPYLFASNRRPIIPRSMKPDVIFCHGPWLKGDYDIGERLLAESANPMILAETPEKIPEIVEPGLIEKALKSLNIGGANDAKDRPGAPGTSTAENTTVPNPSPPSTMHKLGSLFSRSKEEPHAPAPPAAATPPATASQPGTTDHAAYTAEVQSGPTTMIDRLADQLHSWRSAKPKSGSITSEKPQDAPPEPTVVLPPPQRRMVVLVLGISPHRAGLWTSSQRPGESVMNYHLLNGCPALVVPIRTGTPLIAWHGVTLKMLQSMEGGVEGPLFETVLNRINEYVSLCVDWDRIVFPEGSKAEEETNETAGARIVKDGLRLILAGAVRSKDSAEVKKRIDNERAGIVFFRI